MHEIVHDQYAVQAIQQKCSGPVPPATLKAPEVAECRARPAIESALHRQNAVQLCRGVRHWNAPEERHKSKKNQSHSGTGFGKNFFIAERPTSGVAIENCQQRKKSDGADRCCLRNLWRGVGSQCAALAKMLPCLSAVSKRRMAYLRAGNRRWLKRYLKAAIARRFRAKKKLESSAAVRKLASGSAEDKAFGRYFFLISYREAFPAG